MDWYEYFANISPGLQGKIISTIILISGIWLIRLLLLIAVFKKVKEVRLRYHWRKWSLYTCSAFVTAALSIMWLKGLQSLSTFLGLLSAGVAIALKDPLTNLAGWAFILWRKPFEVGDRIQVGSIAGDVIDLRIFQHTLMEIGNWVDADQSTGRIIHSPNGRVFTEPVANYSKGFYYIWNEIPVLVTFESDWKKAKEILIRIANKDAEQLSYAAQQKLKKAAEKFMIFYKKLTPTVYTSVQDCGVLLTIRYLCEPRSRRTTQQAIWEDILEEFSECENIDFAYPTTRFYKNPIEGKEGTKGNCRE
jgi:small-conductance mechanosensitive channel